MDRQEDGRHNMDPSDSYDTRQSKQRASVKWILSKAFNNRVPENIREPYYKDHEDQEHLKPPIVGMLASAELYCMALSNIYSDPNYNNLNHWNILQTLARKGIHVQDPSDCAMTETVLIQTNPLKMSAHICVMEGIMVLYGREVGTRERIAAAVRRWGGSLSGMGLGGPGALPHEESLLSWVGSACQALKQQPVDMDVNMIPTLPVVESLRDLCDGVALAGLISLYCPDVLPPSQIRAPRLASVHDSIHNLTMVQNFCQRHLPYNVFHMMPEDITYMRGSMHQNLLVMLADLFNLLEIHPAKCVRFPSSQDDSSGVGARASSSSNMHGVPHKRCLPPAPSTPIPDLRSGLHTPPPSGTYQQPFTVTRSPSASHMTRGRSAMSANVASQRSACSTPERRSSSPQQNPFVQNDENFVVHRGRGVPTLSSVVRQTDDRGYDNVAAGRPSNWEEQRRSSYAGRRSRRGSVSGSDDSQLTVENFGGSQDRLNFIGRNPEKELATVNSANTSSPRLQGPIEQNIAVRSSLQDARGSIELFYNDNSNSSNFNSNNKNGQEQRERYDRQFSRPEEADRIIDQHQYQSLNRQYSKPEEPERIVESQFRTMTRQHSNDVLMNHDRNQASDVNYHMNNKTKDAIDGEISKTKLASFADFNNSRSNGEQSGIQLVYMYQGKEEPLNKRMSNEKKMMSFNNSPSGTTTWQQQASQNEPHQPNGDSDQSQKMNNRHPMAAEINNIRLKLEEKRRKIEHEKRRMELALHKQRQQLGQSLFLHSIKKMANAKGKSGTSGDGGDVVGGGDGREKDRYTGTSTAECPVSLQDISTEAQSVENKWINQDGSPYVETRRTPDLDGMGIEEYQQSIAKMNSSLHDIQCDIARLTNQQHQIESNPLLQQQTYQQHVQPTMHSNQYGSQHNVSNANYGLQHSNFGSSPHIPHDHQQVLSSIPHGQQVESPSQFFLHGQPTPPPRRTWAQQAQMNNMESAEPRYWQSPDKVQYQQPQQQQQQTQQQIPYQDNSQNSWAPQTGALPMDIKRTLSNTQALNNSQGFVLHENSTKNYPIHGTPPRYQNGSEYGSHSHINYNVSSPHTQPSRLAIQSLFNQHTPPTSSSPQHRPNTPQRQHSLGDLSHAQAPPTVSLQQLSTNTNTTHQVPVRAPTIDDMEPQNISFIGNAEDEALQQGISRLNITSGKSTYRIPSPTRPSLTRNSFQQPVIESNNIGLKNNNSEQSENLNEKGFYISFGGEQPKRPKPPLRTKRGSPKKDRTPSGNQSPERDSHSGDDLWPEKARQPEYDPPVVQKHHQVDNIGPIIHRDTKPQHIQIARVEKDVPAAIIIGNEMPNADTAEEMERKKERIILLSLQRRQAAEEARARSEAVAEARRQKEMAVAEERAARKEQQTQRRDQILQQYKLKKAIEEAEREGKVIDKSELMAALMIKPSLQSSKSNTGTMGGGGAKLRPKGSGATGVGPRARPKTIHVDSGAVQMAEGMLLASRGKQGSSTNLTAGYNSQPSSQLTMRRDYYRGSQDSLADRAGLYKDSPIDESRGMSPGSGHSVLGRRGSYKTSRENVNALESQSQTRGRSKYSTYQNNFKTGRKSSSLMNLCDSGLGRATPPRRAPSPGLRTLPSPSGPGSLPPGLVTKRRTFDDGSSDISSTPSSIMDYSGPRLYKQPATKSNRGIMLNAVEYCVFPGAVNREAKRRVLEEINNSESKHFLVLFRDAGCQFRALYSYCPESDLVSKLYGTGPKLVNDRMFDKFFKYNSGSKCFSQIHTKHLTVTIDAFTIHNSLWQGKKVQLPSKKDMALVI